MRQHRLAFEAAMAMGCTPKQASDELARRAIEERASDARRIRAAVLGRAPPARITNPDCRQFWWLND